MRKVRRLSVSLVAACLTAASVPVTPAAERIVIEAATLGSSIARPPRGMSMVRVEMKFGSPESRFAPVGDPPISRWSYPAFTVYFEHKRVIHTVVRRR